jgi:hypothetical protein
MSDESKAPHFTASAAGSGEPGPLDDAEIREQWALVNTPLGEEWSGRTRYAAAMFFHKRGDMNADTLEVYRLCSRLDSEDPLPIIMDRGVGKAWLERMAADWIMQIQAGSTRDSL